jgi:hypothetical protein
MEHGGGTWRCGDGVERESTVMEHGGGEIMVMEHSGGHGDTLLGSGNAVWSKVLAELTCRSSLRIHPAISLIASRRV